jgi:hypothetical protein
MHDQVHFGVIFDDRIRDLLHDHRLTGLGRRNDETTLPLAERCHQVHEAHGQVAGFTLELETVLRVAWPQVVERDAVLGTLRIVAVDLFDLEQRQVAFALLRWANLAHDGVAGAQIESLDLGRTHVDVIGPIQVIPVLRAQEAVAFREDFEDAFATQDDVAVEKILLYAENQVLLPQAGIIRDVQLLRHFVQLGDGFALQFGDIHV